MIDSTGAIRARYDYDPYGVRTKLSGDLESDFGYTGHYYHQPSGLNLSLYRAYNPTLGRWVNRDPIGENGGINLYGYVGNRPLRLIDLFGLDWLEYTGQTVTWYPGKLGNRSNPLFSCPATSGLDHDPSHTTTPSVDPIPGGDYRINTALDPGRQAEILDSGYLAAGYGIQKADTADSDWGAHRARLEKAPNNPTDRDNFYLHDSHKGYSHGCVEAPSDRLWKKLQEYYDEGNKWLPVRVNYTDPTTLGATRAP